MLTRIQDAQDTFAWHEFVKIYAPMVYCYGRRSGLGDSDAADLARDTLRAVARAVEKSKSDAGRDGFRSWLYDIAQEQYAKMAGRVRSEVSDASPPPPDALAARDVWDEEYDGRLADWAAQQVRSKLQETTWQAFWRAAVEHQLPETVAAELGLRVGQIYLAAYRGLAALREKIELLGDRS